MSMRWCTSKFDWVSVRECFTTDNETSLFSKKNFSNSVNLSIMHVRCYTVTWISSLACNNINQSTDFLLSHLILGHPTVLQRWLGSAAAAADVYHDAGDHQSCLRFVPFRSSTCARAFVLPSVIVRPNNIPDRFPLDLVVTATFRLILCQISDIVDSWLMIWLCVASTAL